jgi:hypothetical protein
MRKLLKSQGFAPEVLVTDKLRSYGAAKSEMRLCARHEQGLRKNNRAENSHLPVRRRERKMQRFKSPWSAQRFLSVHAAVQNTFNVQRHLTSRRASRPPRGSLSDVASRYRGVSRIRPPRFAWPSLVPVTRPVGAFSHPRITTVNVDCYGIGKLAARPLIELLRAGARSRHDEITLTSFRVVERQSS